MCCRSKKEVRVHHANESLDLFKIGIGPSSSHTVGPMRAACCFAERLALCELSEKVANVRLELFGSFAFTGLGHGTDRDVLLGLMMPVLSNRFLRRRQAFQLHADHSNLWTR
jgi:hypothetical protein